MPDDTRSAVTLAVRTETQREIMLTIAEELWTDWCDNRTREEADGGNDVDATRRDVASSEAVCQRLDAGGSCCLIPGAMLDGLYLSLGDYLSAAAEPRNEDRRKALGLAVEVLPLMVALATGMRDTPRIRPAA